MPYLSIGDYKIYYEDYPSLINNAESYPLVFLHGFSLDHRLWLDDAQYFRQWYRVLLLDSKGHGLSDAPLTGYSRDDRVTEVINFMDELAIEKIHLVGLSMGGTTGIGFALKYPQRLSSLTLVSTSAEGYKAGMKLSKIDELAKEKGVEAARQKWIETALLWYKDDKKDIANKLHQMMIDYSGSVWRDPMRGKYPKTNDLEYVDSIEIKTKIFTGELDKLFLPLAIELNKRIPHSELSIFPDVGHIVNLEAPSRFWQELKLFLESV